MNERAVPSVEGAVFGRPLCFTIPELARLLHVGEADVEGQIERGELLGIQEDGAWVVYVDLPDTETVVPRPVTQPDQVTSATAGGPFGHDEVLTVTHAVPRVTPSAPPPIPVSVPVSPVDLTLLINLVRDLTQRNAELLDATMQWRERVQAFELEQQRSFHDATVPDTPDVTAPPTVDDSEIAAELAIEQARRLAVEADNERLIGELRELKRHQQVLQIAFQDPAARAAAGWRTEAAAAPEPWWRRLVRAR